MDKPLTPVLCPDSDCRNVWFTDMFAIGPGTTLRLQDCRVGPCPSCGTMGMIPDGIYTAVSTAFFNSSDFHRVRTAIQSIHRLITDGATEEAVRDACKTSPVRDYFRTLLPRSFQELCLGIAALATAFGGRDALTTIGHLVLPQPAADVINDCDPSSGTLQDDDKKQRTE